MSSNNKEITVTLTQSEYDLLKSRAKSTQLGSAVLLRNQKNEEKWTLHGSICVDRALWKSIGQDLENSPTDEAQVDFSMNQSNYPKHDRLDPIEVKTAPAFWVAGNSEFCVETHSQHVVRDPGSAFDMFAPPEERDVAVGVRQRKSA